LYDKKDTLSTDYVASVLREEAHRMDHNVLVIKNRKKAQVAVISEKSTDNRLESILAPFSKKKKKNGKRKFKGELMVFAGEYNLSLGNLFSVLAKKYEIKKNQIKINREKGDFVIYADRENKDIRILKEWRGGKGEADYVKNKALAKYNLTKPNQPKTKKRR